MPKAFIIRDKETQLYLGKDSERVEFPKDAVKFTKEDLAIDKCQEKDKVVSYWGLF